MKLKIAKGAIIASLVVTLYIISTTNFTKETPNNTLTTKPAIYGKAKEAGNTIAQEIQCGFVVLDFYAALCGPCKILKPIFTQVAKELPSIKFFTVNVEEHAALAKTYNVRAMPTIIILSDGKEVSRASGLMNKTTMNNWIAKHTKYTTH